MSGDHLERLEAFLDHHEAQPWSDAVLLLSDEPDVPDLDVGDLRALATEVKKLRARTREEIERRSYAVTHAKVVEEKCDKALAELERLRAEDGLLKGELLRTLGERDAHHRRQIEAERALIVLLARDGGGTEFSPAELAAADYRGSFVSSRDVATGNKRLRFVTTNAAPQQPEPEPCDGDCDCDCQPGQPCLCPERDCYCGPCRVCGEKPQERP